MAPGAATIEDLSPETLSRVFRLLSISDPSWSEMRHWQGPLALAAVSAEWRRIALDMPELWDRLTFNFTLALKREAPSLHEIAALHSRKVAARTWLMRSGIRPLQLALTYRTRLMTNYSTASHWRVGLVNPLSELVEEFSERVAVLRVVSADMASLDFFDATPSGFPQISELDIVTDTGYEYFAKQASIPSTLLPKLRRFSLAALDGSDMRRCIPISPITNTVDLNNITHLRLVRTAKIVAVYPLLAAFPRLIECHIVTYDSPRTISIPRAKTTLMHLRLLSLELSNGLSMQRLLDHISAPALDSLSLGQCFGFNPDIFDMADGPTHLLPALAPSLRRLSVSIDTPPAVLRDTFTRATRLTELRIVYHPELFAQLAADDLPARLDTLWILIPRAEKNDGTTPAVALDALEAVGRLFLLDIDVTLLVEVDPKAKARLAGGKNEDMRRLERSADAMGLGIRVLFGKEWRHRPCAPMGLHVGIGAEPDVERAFELDFGGNGEY
ncbi:hypothetical protein MKEN_00225300 [Mycena kentingensis (nom. inval.)]|nr:hypothetical protein MKEN_00225300 [Mycena kentingensis (nom. inval.)]